MTEKKSNFLFGLAVGVAVVAVAGWVMMVLGGIKINTPNKASNNQKTVDTGDTGGTQASPPQAQASQVDFTITEDDYIRGNFDAPVTIVEFSDFQCPYCQQFHQTMKQVVSQYPDKVRWVYKHFPLDSIHPNARPAAEASECAAEQGKFWEYADQLFDRQQNLGADTYKAIAGSVGLNMTKFNECVAQNKYSPKVNTDYQLGVKSGVRGTPGNFINGVAYPGALPFEQIQSIIEINPS